MNNLFQSALLALALLGTAHLARAQSAATPYRLLATIPIGGEGGCDFLYVDPTEKRLYVLHST